MAAASTSATRLLPADSRTAVHSRPSFPFPAACSALLLLLAPPGFADTHFVDVSSANPASPYTNWSTAASTIQDAITAAAPGDLVLVTNGFYQIGSTSLGPSMPSANRVAITKLLTVQSVNGPLFTSIVGSNGNLGRWSRIRCAYLTNGSVLSGFTLTNGSTSGGDEFAGGVSLQHAAPFDPVSPGATVSNCIIAGNFGGGAYAVSLNNCILSGNVANYGGGALNCALTNCVISGNTATGLAFLDPKDGGGACRCTLDNCLVLANSATVSSGGGASNCKLINCTIVSNTAADAGGVDSFYVSALTNCLVYYNSASNGSNYSSAFPPTFDHCCTDPMPSGFGNITNPPLFRNPDTGDFRLQPSSPCINAGRNSANLSPTDPDGNPRIAGDTIDIGAYEFQSPASLISYAWLKQYGFQLDGSSDFLDPDNDGMNNWQEWRAGTDPLDPASVLRISSISLSNSVATISWPAIAGITYCLQSSTNLLAQPPFLPIQTNLPSVSGPFTFQHSNSPFCGAVHYRISVQ